MRFRLRTLLIVLALGPIVLAGLVFVPFGIWDGRFALTVRFVNNTGKAIDRIEAADEIKREYADFYVTHPDIEKPRWRTVTLDNNGVGQVDVTCSAHVSQFTGIELSYMQFEAIVMRVFFTDGSQTILAADVPGGNRQRGNRSLDVIIPAPQ